MVRPAVSVSGDAVFDVALLWLVLTTTGSVFLVGITQAVIYLPTVVVAPFAGVYVDRFNRKTAMVVSNVIQGVVIAMISFLYLVDELPFGVLLILIFALYSFSRFFYTATMATIPKLVEDRDNLTDSPALSASGLVTSPGVWGPLTCSRKNSIRRIVKRQGTTNWRSTTAPHSSPATMV